MKNLITFLILSATTFIASCKDFDDSSLWKQVDEAYNQLTEAGKALEEINKQITALSSIVNEGAITGLDIDNDGNYILSYKNSENEEATVEIATSQDVTSDPIIGVKDKDGVLYWTVTISGNTDFLKDTDGAIIPVSGRIPEFSVDNDGYLMINGNHIVDSEGKPVKTEGKKFSLIKKVEILDNGNAELTLGDDSKIQVPIFDDFNMILKIGNERVYNEYIAQDVTSSLTISSEIKIKNSGKVIVKVMREENLTAEYNSESGDITVNFEKEFISGGFIIMLSDVDRNMLIKPLRIYSKDAMPEYQGIKTKEDLILFASYVNAGKSLDRFRNEKGDIILLNDIDMTGIDDFTAIGNDSKPFTGVFNGQNYKIYNISYSKDISSETLIGLFGKTESATIKNLTVGDSDDKLILTGTAQNDTKIGGIVAHLNSSVIINCKNDLDLEFNASDNDGVLVMLGGIVGQSVNSEVGDETPENGCVNNGDIIAGNIENTQNNATKGMQIAGICAYFEGSNSGISQCVNNGHIAAPSGRGGGIIGSFISGKMSECSNNGLIEDDLNKKYSGQEKYGIKRMGGLVGGTTANSSIIKCKNKGTVITHLGCRTGGFVGHNEAEITECVNEGTVIGNTIVDGSNYHGPAWACGYNKNSSLIENCEGYGRVGGYEYVNSIETAPKAMHNTAVAHKRENYDPEKNIVDWKSDEYYDWEQKETKQIYEGVNYSYYEFKNLPRKMHVLEVDLSNQNIEITTSLADDIVPNPNGNNNENNGKNIRETLSENCNRKRSEGFNIIAGVNSGFFNSHDGFPRGIHIENGRPDFVNNLEARTELENHKNAFTVFKDGSVSCGTKSFVGKIQINGKEFEYYSINDTVLRHVSKSMMANVYTNRYKEIPHEANPELKNPLCKSALYIVAENQNQSPIQVNEGWISAKIIEIYDGRTNELTNLPYITDDNRWVLQLTGSLANEIAEIASVGSSIQIKAEVTVEGKNSPILTQNSSMYRFLENGVDKSPQTTKAYDPMTFVGVNKEGNKVYFFVVDGRQPWVSMGVKFYETVRIAQKFDCWNLTRFDGGGSTAMWLYYENEGKIVNTPSDSKGERSCMNYMQIRIKN